MFRLLNVYTISAFAALGGALFGFEISSMSGVVGTDQYKSFYGNPVGTRQGVITSAMAAGSLVGALSSSFLADWLSRKVAIQLGTVVWCIGAAIQASSTGVKMLIIGRVVAGLCIGLTSSIVPIYQSEIAPRKVRGRIVSFQQFAITCGILIQYIIQYGCSFLDSAASFRVPWAIQAVPAIILFIGLFWFPRSPRWLASKDRWDEVLHILAILRTPNCDINDPLVLAEYKENEEQIWTERAEESNSYRELFGKKMRKRLFLGMAVQAWSQLSGTNFFLYFIVYILDSVRISNTLLFSLILYILFMVATIPSILWTDQWGRRPSMLVGSISMAFWLYLVGAPNQAYTWVITGHPAASHTILVSSYMATASFAASWGPVSWMYPTEIIPLRIRAKAVSISTATNWAINFMLGIFFIFGSFNIVAFIHVWLLAPETKQHTLEEMDEIFEHGDLSWRGLTGEHNVHRLDLLANDIRSNRLRQHQTVREKT
ncbi:general substrate transporter [Lipomyces tetrasporus]|uniref:General substrate transporter n=1 Tax=Lipomyces tetrasporus TaxID=54092 RepID=A0AAD7VR91_9ASCO|nr:general substrate transporter [Lipomyces tetrasporus]KAJ8098978.1 general substrate transporter [Lipomyces tetrasporus]